MWVCVCECRAFSSQHWSHSLQSNSWQNYHSSTMLSVCLNVEYSYWEQKERVWAGETGGGGAEQIKRLGLDKEKRTIKWKRQRDGGGDRFNKLREKKMRCTIFLVFCLFNRSIQLTKKHLKAIPITFPVSPSPLFLPPPPPFFFCCSF